MSADDVLRVAGAIVALVGGPTTVALLVRTVWQRWTGRDHRREVRNRTIDQADRERRMALEYASELMRQLLANGIEPSPWPAELGRAPRITRKKES